MALVINDRVKVNSTATGNSQTTFAIDNTPVTGFETFNTGVGVGNTTYYCIFNQGTSEFEVGLGTLSSTTNLQRTTIISSSNSDAVVDIYLLPNDGSTTVPTENNKLYNALTIQATDSYIIDTEKMILSNGDKIYVQNADSSGQVIVTVSTIGL